MLRKYNKVAKEPTAATTYVLAAHLRESSAALCSCEFSMFSVSSHANALLLASYSTGRVIKLKRVPKPNMIIPINRTVLPIAVVAISINPPKITHCENLEATLTTGTSLLLICSQLYAFAC